MGSCCSTSRVAPEDDDVSTGSQISPKIVSSSGCFGGKSRPTLKQLKLKHKPSADEGETEAAADTFVGNSSNGNGLMRSDNSCAQILSEHNVLVAVRLRPLNSREISTKSSCCLKIPNATTVCVEAKEDSGGVGKDASRDFYYDCAFDMNATQAEVYDRTARPLLFKALDGFNCCLFAYGQTGSGKTYTMLGASQNIPQDSDMTGIIPRVLKELFQEIDSRSQCQNRKVEVRISFLEIYNEKINDLLCRGQASRATTSDEALPLPVLERELKLLEDRSEQNRGIIVDGLGEISISSASEAMLLLEEAQTRRAVGRTNMNEHSSRSHAVITMTITKHSVNEIPSVKENCDEIDFESILTTHSKLHLIDLAGSERQKATGAEGARLREGAQINLSLSALGNVINALTSDVSIRRKSSIRKNSNAKIAHVPYRDSKLTRLLQDSLGGNSCTCMLCAISPSSLNRDETIAALRFAERAKKIKNSAKINIDANQLKVVKLLNKVKALTSKVSRLEKYIEDLEKYYE